jgi:hypothetical protein
MSISRNYLIVLPDDFPSSLTVTMLCGCTWTVNRWASALYRAMKRAANSSLCATSPYNVWDRERDWNSVSKIATSPGLLGFVAIMGMSCAGQSPSATIGNGQVTAMLYLPDAQTGYYRGTRFDWSGMVGSLEYAGHNYYGKWFDRVDTKVFDFTFDGEDVVTNPCNSVTGVPEEFVSNHLALGWDEAKAGGTFVKIGIGVLRKPDDLPYSSFRQYEIVDGGKWTVERKSDSVEFTQELADPSSGYGYVYRKRVSLRPGKPQMVLEHTLKNTGKRAIKTSVYDHNFVDWDQQAPGPDWNIRLGFAAHGEIAKGNGLIEFRGNQVVVPRPLRSGDVVMAYINGFGNSSADYDFRVENRKLGLGVRATADRPLAAAAMWSIRSVASLEPFIDMTIGPGDEFSWTIRYDYYTVAKSSH